MTLPSLTTRPGVESGVVLAGSLRLQRLTLAAGWDVLENDVSEIIHEQINIISRLNTTVLKKLLTFKFVNFWIDSRTTFYFISRILTNSFLVAVFEESSDEADEWEKNIVDAFLSSPASWHATIVFSSWIVLDCSIRTQLLSCVAFQVMSAGF